MTVSESANRRLRLAFDCSSDLCRRTLKRIWALPVFSHIEKSKPLLASITNSSLQETAFEFVLGFMLAKAIASLDILFSNLSWP